MKKPSKKSKPIKKQKVRKKNYALKRYNKIVSLIVKDNKKKGIQYNIADVRKQVSENVYPSFKNVPPSQIRLKQIKTKIVESDEQIEEQEDTVKIKAQNIPREYFDVSLEWYELGEENRRNGEINPILELNRNYPDIPIVIQTGDLRLAIKGEIGEYQGGLIQEFVEKIRLFVENKSGFLFSGVPTWFEKKNKQYALWGTEDVAENLPDDAVLDFIDIGLEKPKFKKDKRKEKPKEKPKKAEPKKPKSKEEPKKVEPTIPKTTLAEKNEAIKLLIKQFELGLIDKDEFRAEKKQIMDMYSEGGKI